MRLHPLSFIFLKGCHNNKRYGLISGVSRRNSEGRLFASSGAGAGTSAGTAGFDASRTSVNGLDPPTGGGSAGSKHHQLNTHNLLHILTWKEVHKQGGVITPLLIHG